MNYVKSFFALSLLAFVGFAFTEAVTVSVDTNASEITWKGYKVTGEHAGTIVVKDGNFVYEDNVLKGGSFEIDMTSITCTDLTGEYADKLVGHLKSDDFFGVATYPTAKFVITKVASRGKAGEYKVTGDLTIKETTKEIKFNANVDASSGVPVATADITIDRSDFNVRYGSGSFFDNLGDKTIYDEFDLGLKLVGKQ
ncbi:MAG: YceI family protein [Bacteroidota bacterium]